MQRRSQPHSSGWARVPLSLFFLKLIFFLILALRVGDLQTQEGPGYATVYMFEWLYKSYYLHQT